MSHRKIDELFEGLPNVCGIVDDILIAGFDDLGRDYDATLEKVLRICRGQNKAQQRQMPFQMHQHSFLWEDHIMTV